jgi:hypothetical protein
MKRLGADYLDEQPVGHGVQLSLADNPGGFSFWLALRLASYKG